VAKGMDGRDGALDETLKTRTQIDKRYSSVTTLVIGSIAAAGPWRTFRLDPRMSLFLRRHCHKTIAGIALRRPQTAFVIFLF
jgi:hypothetical protein